MARVRIGCSGFSYKDWKDNFYPGDMPGRNWLAHYSGIFPTVELNVTFYRLPATEVFAKWYGETPAEFSFALKGSRLITHLKRLKDVEGLLERFFAQIPVVDIHVVNPDYLITSENLIFLFCLRPEGSIWDWVCATFFSS